MPASLGGTTADAPANSASAATSFDPALVATLIRDARALGDPLHGAAVFASAKSACLSCHRVKDQGGLTGPDLSTVGACLKPEEIVESILWPRRTVKEGYACVSVATSDGKVRQGYKLSETPAELVLRVPTSAEQFRVSKPDIEAVRQDGSLMPDGLAATMSAAEKRDLVRFLLEMGHPGGTAAAGHLARHSAVPASFAVTDPKPLRPDLSPSWQLPANRHRVYDWYAKQADYFSKQPNPPFLLPVYPGIDGGAEVEETESDVPDGRWNQADLGSVLCGVFRGAGVTVPKAVCVRLGDQGELAVCFNPETLSYDALWRGGFFKFTSRRHGFMDGLRMDGSALAKPEGKTPEKPFVYHGFYRHGKRIIFAYRLGDTEMLDSPWVENGQFTRIVAPAAEHPMREMIHGGPAQWPQVFTTRGKLGPNGAGPYVVDTIEPPFDNPWKAPLFFGDHDFFPDGTAMLCTMQGDVWRVDGLDEKLQQVRWRRFATGLHQALGLVVAEGQVYVVGRDQITRLRDLDGDGEADFYECFSNAYRTSTFAHDFLCGLERDTQGRFYSASSDLGLLRISADGRSVETLATGFRNPDGLGLTSDGTITVPNSQGNWIPASMICEVRPGDHFGYRGPRAGQPPALPLVYIPYGLDNSSSGQVTVPDGRFGPLQGQLLHSSFGMGAYFLVLREKVDGQPQGAIMTMPGEFLSGAHRMRFNPKDGQLYVTGMAGWGTHTSADGCFQRVRYTGAPVQLPIAYHAHENGVLVTFSGPVERDVAERPNQHLVQAWNYRYSPNYGSPEFSTRHPGHPGHDLLTVASAHVLSDGRTLFLEIPELQPVNQLHLHIRPDAGPAIDLFGTIHRLAAPFTGFPGYHAVAKTIAAHPILADMIALSRPPLRNPWRRSISGARDVTIEAGTNLSFTVKSFKVRAGEPIRFRFDNPDSVPHNWALLKPGATAAVGNLVNKMIAEPDAAYRHYVPKTDLVLFYTDIVEPQSKFTIFFRAPDKPGRYPYICTFPGHWMVMNGEMIVE